MDVAEETIIFADSGGFDFQEEEVDTTPAKTLETQRELDADIFGTVDIPLSRDNRNAENQRRINQSIEFALEASDRHDGEEILLASVHGYDPETIRNSIGHLEEEGEFDGYAIGSLVPIRTDYEKVTKIILSARRATDKHIHTYGLGGVTYQPLLLYLGVDSFDSSAFIRSAGKRNYLMPGFGGEPLTNIDDLAYLPCACPVCSSKSFETIRADRDLLAKHNLWALALELRRFRYMQSSGEDLEAYLDLRFQGNEVTKRAYRMAKQQVRRLT
jgi:tRNA-guanine family transglycosylase